LTDQSALALRFVPSTQTYNRFQDWKAKCVTEADDLLQWQCFGLRHFRIRKAFERWKGIFLRWNFLTRLRNPLYHCLSSVLVANDELLEIIVRAMSVVLHRIQEVGRGGFVSVAVPRNIC
jgi:hypothetical protein